MFPKLCLQRVQLRMYWYLQKEIEIPHFHTFLHARVLSPNLFTFRLKSVTALEMDFINTIFIASLLFQSPPCSLALKRTTACER